MEPVPDDESVVQKRCRQSRLSRALSIIDKRIQSSIDAVTVH